MRRALVLLPIIALLAGAASVTIPATGSEKGRPQGTAPALLSHLSQGVQLHYYLAHPDQAPASLRVGIEALTGDASRSAQTRQRSAAQPAVVGDLFNDDDIGLPQNEESVTVCRSRQNIVEGGTNDYRGILDPKGNFGGWYFSNDGGRSVTNEGLLPALFTNGERLPSGGDPVSQSDGDCNIYMANLNYGPDPFGQGRNGIGVYRTTPEILRSCARGEDPSNLTHPECWPKRRLVATAGVAGGVGHFLDKEWLDVGTSGKAGRVVWVTYSDFAADVNAPLGFTGAQIKAVRCRADLAHCTAPILISGTDADIQFSDVTISESGATLVTWAQIEGELEQTAQTFTVKARIAPPGSTRFGPTRIVSRVTNPIPFGGVLHANDFRVATNPKSIMPTVNGKPRPYVVFERCRFRLLDNICEESEIVMTYSSNLGRTWTTPRRISKAGDNYMPAISDEGSSNRFLVAYYTNRRDQIFHNRQDVEMVTISAGSGGITNRQRVTPRSNETEADWLVGGFFIGDYFDVDLVRGTAYVHFNANYRSVRVLGQGFPIPQQDNYLIRTPAS